MPRRQETIAVRVQVAHRGKMETLGVATWDSVAHEAITGFAAKQKIIATGISTRVRTRATIDWTLREGARAKIRVVVKRVLNRFGYPPDLQENAVKTVPMQAELLCANRAA